MKRRERKGRKGHSNEKTLPVGKSLPVVELPRWKAGTVIALLVVVGLGLALNFTGINWGQPGGNPWQPDSIAGAKTVHHIPNLFSQWKHKYPRAHFMVVAAFYKPFLSYWENNPVPVPAVGGRRAGKEVLNTERLSTLVIVSRIVTILMSAGAVVAVFLTARLLFSDDVAAFFSGLALVLSMLFVFYSHLGNVDVPCAFWFAWSLYYAVKATYIGKWRHFVLLGLFSALAICTKDPVAGYVIGLWVAMWVAMAGAARDSGKPFKKALASIFRVKVFVAAVIAAFCFALLNDLLTTPEAFFRRMDFWFEVSVPGYNKGFTGYWPFMLRVCRVFYYSLGWPLFAVIIASTIYCIIKFRWKSAFGILPMVIFYIVVIMKTLQTRSINGQ